MGRHSTYTTTLADEIVARISDGEPLRQICRDEHMPSWRTVYDWLTSSDDFSTRFARARELGFDAIAQECLDIADDGRNDYMAKIDEEDELVAGYRFNGEHVQRSKLRIETRLKLLAKWDPKRYGDRLDLNHGGQAGSPIHFNITKDDENL